MILKLKEEIYGKNFTINIENVIEIKHSRDIIVVSSALFN